MRVRIRDHGNSAKMYRIPCVTQSPGQTIPIERAENDPIGRISQPSSGQLWNSRERWNELAVEVV